ncbi:AAA family ATPase [Arthrobacter mangrovi]|uniref:Uncharacterized protein n=1 Tax=Arthrobacter mangrovi TaxID=2966350 RepID=A0ABQ5MVC0_9MICC|nr:ATP-binding protein [Arthrobacter mangrovi]GLB67888.1 hypothetical protein AHIS1636_23280 [Arthrobacter mangrovi]
MTYIIEFTVTNLAGRGDVISRKLDRYVNVFWGLNGSGKTTLLQILDCALSNSTAPLKQLPFDHADVVFYSEKHNAVIRRVFSKKESDFEIEEEDPVEFSFVTEVSTLDDTDWFSHKEESWSTTIEMQGEIPDRAYSARYAHTYLPISRVVARRLITSGRSNSAAAIKEQVSADERFVQQVKNVWLHYSALSSSRIREIQQQGLASVLAMLFGGAFGAGGVNRPEGMEHGSAEEAYELVRTFLSEQRLSLRVSKRDFMEKYNLSEEHRRVVAEIKQVRREVEEALGPQLELQSVIGEMYLGNKHLFLDKRERGFSSQLEVRIADKVIPLSSLSSGEKQLLHVLLEVLAIGPSTIMIDEPELSLHVDWQQSLILSMQRVNPEAQLLLATHSPEVMMDIQDRYVFEL